MDEDRARRRKGILRSRDIVRGQESEKRKSGGERKKRKERGRAGERGGYLYMHLFCMTGMVARKRSTQVIEMVVKSAALKYSQ